MLLYFCNDYVFSHVSFHTILIDLLINDSFFFHIIGSLMFLPFMFTFWIVF
jgi:hypothetical protein